MKLETFNKSSNHITDTWNSYEVSIIPDHKIYKIIFEYTDPNCVKPGELLARISIISVLSNGDNRIYDDFKEISLQQGITKYIKINDKDKFVLKTLNDIKKLYTYLSGTDINKFVEDFELEDKLNDFENKKVSIEKDFEE